MSSYLRQIADALAHGLATVSWTPSDTAVERRNWVSVDLEGMRSPVVFVTPGNAEVTRISRQVSQIEYTVTVFVGRHVKTDSEVDGMIDLADEVLLHIRAHDWGEAVAWPEGVTSPQSVSIELNPDDGLNERNAWRAVIEARYVVFQQDALPSEG